MLMIDIAYVRTPTMESMAKKLGITLWYIGEQVVFAPKRAKLTIADGQDPQLRTLIERGAANAIIGLELLDARDSMHARKAGLNQVLAVILAKKHCTVLFDHATIRNAKRERRAQILGRMQQNVLLCRKYHVRMAVVTMARSPYQLRSPHDLRAFCLQLGMLPGEANQVMRT